MRLIIPSTAMFSNPNQRLKTYLNEYDLQSHKLLSVWAPWNFIKWMIAIVYGLVQGIIVLLFKPVSCSRHGIRFWSHFATVFS